MKPCLLIGRDLIEAIRLSSKKWGYMDGFISYDVYGISAVDVGNDEKKTCKASQSIIKHRMYLNYFRENQAYWLKVSKGFIDSLLSAKRHKDFIRRNLPHFLYQRVKKRGIHCILVVEDQDASFVEIISNEGKRFIYAGEIQILEEDSDPFKRVDGIMPIEELKTKKVAIIGLGSGGSHIAMELAAAGIGTMYFIDKDRLNRDNLFRHLCGEKDLGRTKTTAVKTVIGEHLLPIRIITHDEDIMLFTEKTREIINEVDLIVCATDNTDTRSMINYMCVIAGKPLVLACTFDNARIGEILRVFPGQAACLDCSRHWLEGEGVLKQDRTEENERVSYGSQSEEDSSRSQGTRSDILIVAAMAAKTVLMTLLSKSQNLYGELPFNYITWGATRMNDYPAPYDFALPFETKYRNYSIHHNCPMCGAFPPELVGIDCEEKYREIMQNLPRKDTQAS